jgi:hypothetical protein
MKGLAFSPGMKTRITTGLYAFPSPEWDVVSESSMTIKIIGRKVVGRAHSGRTMSVHFGLARSHPS